MAARCRQIVDSRWFDPLILGVIVVNAIVLALATYESVERELGGGLELANELILGVFVVELGLRLAAHGRRPTGFFRNGWNVFDFVVVAASLTPGLRENITLVRLARLLRVVRAVRLLPDLRVLTVAIGRAVPGVLSLAALTLLLVYAYGMVGWIVFSDHDPDNYGNAGQAMLTMFVMLTLENLPDHIEAGQQLSNWTLLFFISYVLLAAFLVFNLFIGIVINSMEEARAIELRRAERALLDDDATNDEQAHAVILDERVRALKAAVEELERELAAGRRARMR